MAETNHRITLAQRPVGAVTDSCFRADDVDIPTPGPGEMLVEVRWLSIDPTIRGWMAHDTYLPAIEIGAPIRSGGLGTVIESNNDDYPVGSLLFGMTGWQQYAVMDAASQVVPDGVEPEAALSVYGVTGLTAYFGLLDVGRPVAGETVLVSGAAGATGSVVGQIARIKGCRVVGIAGSDEKCAWLTEELGFDAAINYRTDDVAVAMAAACPDGVDVFFDNVGGDILEAAIGNLALRGRIVLCGAIAQYNDETPRPGPANLATLIANRGRMEGFIILDYLDRAAEAMLELAGWVMGGELTYRTDVIDGLDNAPAALERLFTGANQGKVMVRLETS
ncbi:MAG: NADP-dependent oxidoreductase [Acidimicrobiia bacterium]|nr:NADP-dependent oxidoreductase [Acidimicrobiia bacterium]